MHPPYLVSLESSGDRALCGGKASGLAALLHRGFRVPPGVCVTTRAYIDTLRAAKLNPHEQWAQAKHASRPDRERILEEYRTRIASLTIPPEVLRSLESALNTISQAFTSNPAALWAVRSSATSEDDAKRTFAGLYRTLLGVPRVAIPAAITECWASLWTTAAWSYSAREEFPSHVPAMAVIVQPLLVPRAAGVAYSHHPVTRERNHVVINAVLGSAEPLVKGTVTPDCYLVHIAPDTDSFHLLERHLASKRRQPTGRGPDRLALVSDQEHPSLADEEAFALARLTKQVEHAMNHAVDVEWAIDERGLWLLQARPIPETATKPALGTLTDATCAWSRANFKETLPDQPSPLGLSFLRQFMETNILQPYLQLGCSIPSGLSSVRIIRGRPYINVTLFQSFMAQLGGDPALVAEQMGGHAPAPPAVKRLPWWMLLRAGLMMEWKIRQAARRAPRWFAEMKHMAETYKDSAIDCVSPAELLTRLDQLGERLSSHDLTFAIVAGVSQGFYALQRLLERRMGKSWRPLLNAALQGSGTVVSARQILWLAECADIAREEPVAVKFFYAVPWAPEQFRDTLAGTRFLHAFDAYLAEYGHRAVGESDVMSPRFSEVPQYVLSVIRGQVISPPPLSMRELRRRQSSAREQSLQRIRSAFGWRYHEWMYLNWWHGRLSRFLALREANRHHLMHFTAAVRQLLLMLGRQFTSCGVLNRQDDIFFLTNEEIRALVSGKAEHGISLVAARRAEGARNAVQPAPDFVMDHGSVAQRNDSPKASSERTLHGLSISSGMVSGPVRLIHSQEDFKHIQRGDIVVTAVLDPGMASFFGLAGGFIAEMGGILSHGAIIAREYGIPTVANVHGITRLVQDGQQIILNADTGQVIIFS
ncbi:MAG TPA: PEP/pyruvate-binding domain-containing protein [Nitrospiraceae bacterium]|nr:PEP/pyruvate-binding domain-containing protein [Nitrospiraceae bacterium]